MAIPAYLWLKDDGGALIKGAVDVQGRESSIEVNGFSHNVSIPTDPLTGKITGTRKHSSIIFLKEFDSSSPYLFKAVCIGQKLISAELNGIVLMMPGKKLNITICFWRTLLLLGFHQ